MRPDAGGQWHYAGDGAGLTRVRGPGVWRLLVMLAPSCSVWTFGTGLRALEAADVEPLSALVVEVWPSMFEGKPNAGEFKDQAQVRATAEALAKMDEAGDLSKAFAPPKGVDEALVGRVEQEEGWILGA